MTQFEAVRQSDGVCQGPRPGGGEREGPAGQEDGLQPGAGDGVGQFQCSPSDY